MNLNKSSTRKSQSGRLCWILVALTALFFETTAAGHYSDACRSIHGQLGTCVPLATCPLFSSWLKTRPLVRENLRLLVKYTCYFDTKHPKVCCPNSNLVQEQEEDDPFALRLATPVRRGIDNKSPNSPNKLLYPESLSFPHTSSAATGNKETHNGHKEAVPISSGDRTREHAPLLFPTEQSHGPYQTQNERGISSIWNNVGNKNNNMKDPSISKKDLRHHPNFKLIPSLHECSNAVKLDSLIDGTYGAYPWLALIGIKPGRRSLDFEHVCAGAIVNERYILTTAHCFDRTKPKLGFVRLGEYDLETLIDHGSEYLPQSRREDYRIEKLTIHPDYNQETGSNDIALIRVERPIALNTTFIRAVCLPFVMEYGIENRLDVSSVTDLEGKPAWVAGWSRHSWGERYSMGSLSTVLHEGIVEFTSHDKCRLDYSTLSQFSSRTQLCVGGKGRRNSCVPDSGGPLMYPIKVPSKVEGFVEPKFFMLGLLSRGPTGNVCQILNEGGEDDIDLQKREAASRSLPTSVYTRVSKYLSWMLDNMQE